MSDEIEGEPPVPAPLIDRFGADLIDYVLLGLLTVFPLTLLLQDPGATRPSLLVIGIAQGLAGVYEVACVTLWGKTIGRHVMRVQVVSVDGRGGVTLWKSFVRWCLKLWVPLSYVAIAVPSSNTVVGPLVRAAQLVVVASVLVSAARRGIHDLAAGTAVVSRRPRVAAGEPA